MGAGGERVKFSEEGWGARALLHFHFLGLYRSRRQGLGLRSREEGNGWERVGWVWGGWVGGGGGVGGLRGLLKFDTGCNSNCS